MLGSYSAGPDSVWLQTSPSRNMAAPTQGAVNLLSLEEKGAVGVQKRLAAREGLRSPVVKDQDATQVPGGRAQGYPRSKNKIKKF